MFSLILATSLELFIPHSLPLNSWRGKFRRSWDQLMTLTKDTSWSTFYRDLSPWVLWVPGDILLSTRVASPACYLSGLKNQIIEIIILVSSVWPTSLSWFNFKYQVQLGKKRIWLKIALWMGFRLRNIIIDLRLIKDFLLSQFPDSLNNWMTLWK